jgi:hypothetical protein
MMKSVEEEVWIVPGLSPSRPRKHRSEADRNYLHAPMDVIADGVSGASLVWLRLLQLQCMKPEDKHHVLANEWLAQYGVDRKVKARALASLEKRGLIKMSHPNNGSAPRISIIQSKKRRVSKSRRGVT